MGHPRAHAPYPAYATLLGTFLGGIAATAGLAARRGRASSTRTSFDLAILTLATFKVARTVAHDEITSFIREPFVDDRNPFEPEQPVRGGFRQAVGELVTCSRCVGTWAAAGITAVDLLAPRFGRTLNWALALGGLNDWMQAGFAALSGAADRLQQ